MQVTERRSVTIVTPPASEPVGLTEAKLFLRLDGDDEDLLVLEMIAAARALAEQYLRRSLISQTLRLTLDRFPRQRERANDWWDGVREAPITAVLGDYRPVDLPLGPVQSITSVVTYSETGTAVTQPSSMYALDAAGMRVYLKEGQLWPTDLREQAAIEITYLAGYGASAAAVPAPIRLAIKQAAAQFYHARDCGGLPEAAMALLKPYRVMGGV
jgi:hypothetical protein